mmetsp:Transcript_16448/g.29075  ORF Transcript_16448/g.29075 Transcript_16448/m.29075 type:complete len:476 (+) Transcript_16448:65-1492(+)
MAGAQIIRERKRSQIETTLSKILGLKGSDAVPIQTMCRRLATVCEQAVYLECNSERQYNDRVQYRLYTFEKNYTAARTEIMTALTKVSTQSQKQEMANTSCRKSPTSILELPTTDVPDHSKDLDLLLSSERFLVSFVRIARQYYKSLEKELYQKLRSERGVIFFQQRLAQVKEYICYCLESLDCIREVNNRKTVSITGSTLASFRRSLPNVQAAYIKMEQKLRAASRIHPTPLGVLLEGSNKDEKAATQTLAGDDDSLTDTAAPQSKKPRLGTAAASCYHLNPADKQKFPLQVKKEEKLQVPSISRHLEGPSLQTENAHREKGLGNESLSFPVSDLQEGGGQEPDGVADFEFDLAIMNEESFLDDLNMIGTEEATAHEGDLVSVEKNKGGGERQPNIQNENQLSQRIDDRMMLTTNYTNLKEIKGVPSLKADNSDIFSAARTALLKSKGMKKNNELSYSPSPSPSMHSQQCLPAF